MHGRILPNLNRLKGLMMLISVNCHMLGAMILENAPHILEKRDKNKVCKKRQQAENTINKIEQNASLPNKNVSQEQRGNNKQGYGKSNRHQKRKNHLPGTKSVPAFFVLFACRVC